MLTSPMNYTVIAIIVLAILDSCAYIVPQQQAFIVERLVNSIP